MLNTSGDQSSVFEPLFVSTKSTRRTLGDIGETTLWDFVKRGLLHPHYSGRKALFAYAEVKELGRRIQAGELALARKGFTNHRAAITNSIASRRRRAQVPAGEPPDPSLNRSDSGRRP
jgi:hypothetical protein